MKKKLLLDTDVLVDYFRGNSKAINFIKRNSKQIVLSTIVVAELYAGTKDADEIKILDDFVFLFPILPVTQDIAKAGGLYKQEFLKSHNIGLADAIIAATAEKHNAELKTLNTKHYPMFKGLKPAYIKN